MKHDILPFSFVVLASAMHCTPTPEPPSAPRSVIVDDAPATPSAAPAPPRVGHGPCNSVRSCLTTCAFCNPETKHYVSRTLQTCSDSCPALQVAAAPPERVPPGVHGIMLGESSRGFARCRELGGDWILATPKETANGLEAKCIGAPGPWGLNADWWLYGVGNTDRVEMRFEVATGETAAELALWVAQLVSQELGAPTHAEPGSYSWMPESGPYWAVRADADENEARLWVKEQL